MKKGKEVLNLNGGFMTKKRKTINLLLIFIIAISVFMGCSDSKSTEPKLEQATVVITLSTNLIGSGVDVLVTLTNIDGNPAHVYSIVTSNNIVNISNVVFGTYTLVVTHPNYEVFTITNFSVQETFINQPVTLRRVYVIGDRGPAGGIIFFDKGTFSNDWRYLEAAPASREFSADWGAWSGNIVYHNVPGTETDVGAGRRNTMLIIAILNQLGQTGRAAQLCDAMTVNGFSDWFLPSRDELNLMYMNLHLQGIGGFGQETGTFGRSYFSSSQVSSQTVWVQRFDIAWQGSGSKDFANRVRAVRAF